MTTQDHSNDDASIDFDNEDSNRSDNPHFADILDASLSRRGVLKGGIGLAVGAGLFGHMGVGQAANSALPRTPRLPSRGPSPSLGFEAVAITRFDGVIVPPGYKAQVLIPWGTAITGSLPAYRDGGLNSGAEQEQQTGMDHDGMHFFAMGTGAEGNEHGLLCVNHEAINTNILHSGGPTSGPGGVRIVPDEVRKEVAAHGISVVEIARDGTGQWRPMASALNRRITAGTPMQLSGPVRGSAKVRTKYSPEGIGARGTVNNCSNGFTPWNTYLTCEENWASYFVDGSSPQPREHARYGVPAATSRHNWHTVTAVDEYARFNAAPNGANAAADYRNEPNTYGWVVEIDPFDPTSVPKKRTALGRFGHEGCVYAPVRNAKPVVFYMGDDANNEYIYKFVSRDGYNAAAPDRDMLDNGTLYVARFNADGTGRWLALDFASPAFKAAAAARGVTFEDHADVLINTRLAADVMGATKMDRPEWGAVDPFTGYVYFTLTNNSSRTAAVASNPRGPNPYGHIIRWLEQKGSFAATSFLWDIFSLAGPTTDSRDLAGKSLTDENIHASPDGLWFDAQGRMWIQTDMSGSQLNTGPFGNNQMLAANPATGQIKRFLVGPPDCELTGITATPDGKTLFANIQHPGDAGNSHWPDGGAARPRSATLVITRDDGGVIGA